MDFTNQDRADRCQKALEAYESDETFVGRLIDILADARHGCDQNGQRYAELDRQAHQHHLGEMDEEPGGQSSHPHSTRAVSTR